MLEIKDGIELDRSIFGYFDRCFLANQVLAKTKFEGKNQVTTNLSSLALEKFNGYEIIKHKLACKEKIEFTATDITYEPIYDEKVPLPCFFTNQIHLACR